MGNHYYATLSHTDSDALPLVQQFDSRTRRDQWVQHSHLAGYDIEVRKIAARQAGLLTLKLVNRLDWYLRQSSEYKPLANLKDEYYLRRNPFCYHDGNHDAPLSTVVSSYRPYLRWRESNPWEYEVWYWWLPLTSPEDVNLAETFKTHLDELRKQEDNGHLHRMTAEIEWLTVPEVNLITEVGPAQNWWPRYSHSNMGDWTRQRIRKATETTDPKDLVDIVYKLGLFLPKEAIY